ncbi:MAG TPA: L,D-transpeptidase family protein [Acidimicrobiales bacterium]|nr:L,D-transpeptidase family protein [Acidimicrobiales bacterium]
MGLAATVALGLVAGGGLSAAAAAQVGETSSVPGSPSAITFSGASSAGATAPAPSPIPAPSPVPVAPAAPAPTSSAPAATAAGPLELEQQLANLRYDVGAVDGHIDHVTASAIMAFQKVNGMERTGQATPDVVSRAMSTNDTPAALVPGGGANRVEIDLGRQVLFLYEGDALSRILPVSSGNGENFCDGGRCRDAITPTGDFAIYRQAQGWEYGPLGALYNPQYFVGGVAIHGSKSVPAHPASHGCVRIPMSAAEWFPNHVSKGTPVYVR